MLVGDTDTNMWDIVNMPGYLQELVLPSTNVC